MANKALSTRQKMRIRIEPSQQAPRNPVAAAAKARAAGPHTKSTGALRQQARRAIANIKLEPEPE